MIRKIIAVVLSIMVLLFTIISILAVWEVITIQDVMTKSLKTLFVIFGSSAVSLFIFSVVYKGDDDPPIQNIN